MKICLVSCFFLSVCYGFLLKEGCEDKINCRPYPREKICNLTSPYYNWTMIWCLTYCGICENFTLTPPPCVDKILNCHEYDKDLCTNPLYRLFREDNCYKFCGLCKQ